MWEIKLFDYPYMHKPVHNRLLRLQMKKSLCAYEKKPPITAQMKAVRPSPFITDMSAPASNSCLVMVCLNNCEDKVSAVSPCEFCGF